MTNTPTTAPTNGRDVWVITGLSAVAVTAAIASFSTLASLAETVGWESWTSWLLPGCIDALAVAAGRVWLSSTATASARRYGRAVTLAAIATSVIGNAVGHLFTAGYLTRDGAAGIALVILVGAIPPAALGAVGHLAALAGTPIAATRDETTAEHASSAVTTPKADTSTATGTSPEPAPGPGTRDTATTPTKPARSRSASPKQRETRPRTPKQDTGTGRNAARVHWDTERANGRTPSGAELARVADVDPSLGRRWRRDFETSDQSDTSQATTGTGTADVVAITEGNAA